MTGNERMTAAQERFPWVSLWCAGADLRGSAKGNDLTFDRLAEIAVYFGTKNINIGAEEDPDYSEETPGGPPYVVFVIVDGAKLLAGPPLPGEF